MKRFSISMWIKKYKKQIKKALALGFSIQVYWIKPFTDELKIYDITHGLVE
jgi:hypothetical protein